MKRETIGFDVVVCGGGLAGLCAAVGAARQGAKACLIQDRPVLGGNSSSEVRVPPHGAAAFHAYARETGIISEITVEDRFRNHEYIQENGGVNSAWDMVLYNLAMTTPNLTLYLSTSVTGVMMEGEKEVRTSGPLPQDKGYWHRPACNTSRRITSVVTRVLGSEIEREITGRVFIDCTGDASVADLAGCEWRMGSEGREEFGETHAPQTASKDTMGNSIHFRTKDMGRPVPFEPPAWAVKHEDPRFFYEQGRGLYDLRGGFWWIEIGVPWDTIYQNEKIRTELTRHCLGVWDWMKNRDPKLKDRAANLALDWIGQVPGKRESRRVIGQYFMTEHDVVACTKFDDEIAFGGWFVDLHTPGGLLAGSSEPAAAEGYAAKSDYAAKSYCGPYGIPLRCLISKDVDNLLMAGRNISVTHAALGTVRVMGTTALMGQAAGVTAAMAVCRNRELATLGGKGAQPVQQELLRGGCFLPNYAAGDPADLAHSATVSASSEATLWGISEDDQVYPPAISRGRSPDDTLRDRRGQWIPISEGRIDAIEVLLSNTSTQPQQVKAYIYAVEHIWDYRVTPGKPLAETALQVAPGARQQIRWEPKIAGLPARCLVRLDLDANPNLIWHTSRRHIPGMVSAFAMNAKQMRRYQDGVTSVFRIEPGQRCFAAQEVRSGVIRPHRFTNMWRSDPAKPLPQYVQLAWDKPQAIRQVELAFAGSIETEYHRYPPLYRDPQTVRDYAIEAEIAGQWKQLLRIEGNYQIQRRHDLPELVTASKLRVVVYATNGEASATICEVRVY